MQAHSYYHLCNLLLLLAIDQAAVGANHALQLFITVQEAPDAYHAQNEIQVVVSFLPCSDKTSLSGMSTSLSTS